MTFYEEIITIAEADYTAHGISATYIPKDGIPSSIKYFPGDQNPSVSIEIMPSDSKVISVLISQVSNPEHGAQFIIDDETWYFKNVLSGSDSEFGEAILELTRSERRQI